MLRKNKGTLILTTLVLLLPTIAGLLLWNKLPDQIPSHWNFNGEIDGWSSKGFAVFGIPAMILALHWVCVIVSLADPQHKNYTPKMLTLVLWICPVISLVLAALVYGTALGYALSVEVIIPLLVGLMFIVIGNLLPKCRQTYTMGIKLPWTFASEENWNKTHRFGGKVWVIGGAVTMITSFLSNFWILLVIIALMAILPTLYSYLYYVKHEKKDEAHGNI